MAKRRKKKSWAGKLVVLLFMIGVVVSLSILFKEEILSTLHPLFEELGLVEAKKEIVLYFTDSDGEFLIGEKRKVVKKKGDKEEAKELVNELIKGPKGNLIPTLPSHTKCLSLNIDGKGTAFVNFNKALAKDHPGGSSAEIMTTYSIVNSLAQNFPRIKQVQILIEGKPVETIAGHLSLRQPIAPNPKLIKRR